MRVLLIGKGGREHALATKLSRSPLLTRLFLWPASPVTAPLGETLDVAPDAALADVVAVAKRHAVDLIVSGPEAPLSQGLADIAKRAGLPCFGPAQAAAELETSKAFAKRIMEKAGVPTAGYGLARGEAECRSLAEAALAARGGVVLKASGLAAGKGVFVCTTAADVEEGLRHLYRTDMRSAADTVVVEELLVGRECSYFTFIGRGGATGLGFAVDFKRVDDGDVGPNTGGMGCYAPVPWLPADAEAQVQTRVVQPVLKALASEGLEYVGCLYVGVMWHPSEGPKVVEFNVRLGDPEAQVLAAYDDRDWLAIIADKCGLRVASSAVQAATAPVAHGERAVAVVMASKSYPFGDGTDVHAELPPSLFEGTGPVRVFGASVSPSGAMIKTGKGRVLTVTARARTFRAARELAYAKVKDIAATWPGARWRTDIAQRISAEAD